MALIGYVRCSTDKQTVMQQCDALRAAGCKRIYKDWAVRATSRQRPGLQAVRGALRPGDTFVVTAIDRAFRSTMEAMTFLDDVLTKDGIAFRSLSQHIDTRTPEGRRWYTYASADAEYERALIARRTREAMAAQMRRGRKFGRPRKLSKKGIAWARRELANGRTMRAISRQMRISPRTLSRAMARKP